MSLEKSINHSVVHEGGSWEYPPYIEIGPEIKVDMESRTADQIILRQTYESWNLTEDEIVTVNDYLTNFCITQLDLEGKRILDIGSGPGNFGRALRKMDIDAAVINFDSGGVFPRSMDIKGKAEQLPFADESFDLVLAHCSVPVMQATRGDPSEIPTTITEMVRVAGKNGKIKIYPGFIIKGGFSDMEAKYEALNRETLRQVEKLHAEFPEYSFRIVEIIHGPTGDSSSDSLLAALEITKKEEKIN
jgi:ubiquinone/menaquinone biosynthesis C-methylase UbiE